MTNIITYIKYARRLNVILFSIIGLAFCAGLISCTVQGAYSAPITPQDIIYKGGTLISDETWTSDNVYVITGTNLIVGQGVTLTIEADTVIKIYRGELDYNHYIDVQGNLNLLGSLGHEIVVTSYRDDTYGGDTNGDGNNTIPAPGDWLGLYIRNDSTTFQNTIVRYSTNGLAVYNDQSIDIQPLVTHNTFEKNIRGVSLFIASDSNISSEIQQNIFTHNQYGLYTCQRCYDENATGVALPELENNEFNNNSILPIYLNGPAFPTYEGNTFIGFPTALQRLGIGLGGLIDHVGEWTIVNSANDGSGIDLPYVVLDNLTISPGTTITIPSNAILKFSQDKYLDTQGALILQSSSIETIITFTSIRDDANGGDTNGDGADTEPEPGDWLGLYLENSLTAVSYISVLFSENGLAVWNPTTDTICPSITDSFFISNTIGIQLHVDSSGNITSLIQNNQINNNKYGIKTTQRIIPPNTPVTGTSLPVVTSNNFSGNTGLPIYLAGSAFPTYSGNTFSGYPEIDQRLGIGLSGTFTISGTWEIVNDMPYAVLGNTIIAVNSIVTLPENIIVKLDTSTYMDVKGALNLQSSSMNPIDFTSFKDDLGGDTNGDRAGTSPAPGDWDSIYLENAITPIIYTNIKYAKAGLTLYNNTAETFALTITNNNFIFNKTGLYYRSCSTGVNAGILADNIITNTDGFPIILNGTAFPIYQNNTFENNHLPAIALTGDWYSSGTWPDVVGDQSQVFPYVIITAVTCDNQQSIGGVRITQGNEIIATAGAVFKFDANAWMDVIGELSMQSSPGEEIVFTSFRDDTVKGDTNGDGDNTTPARGDYDSIYLESSFTDFHDAIVMYSNRGVQVYNVTTSDINPILRDNYFEQNNYAIYLRTIHSGNIRSVISQNQLNNNGFGIGTYASTTSPFDPLVGGAYPEILNNLIINCSIFPIFLDGTAEPVYTDNSFSNNFFPAIALGGFWNADVTWVKVPGDNGQVFPYVVIKSITEDRGINPFNPVTITIPEGLVIKFDEEMFGNDVYFYVYGLLNLQSYQNAPIIITSFYDDNYAGDTNHDGGATQPGLADWKTIWLMDSVDKRNDIHDIIAKHATAAIGVYYEGPANTQIDTIIRDSTFSENHVGVVLAIGWENPNICIPCQGEGNIISPITNVIFSNNLFGLVTFAHRNSTGYSAPTLTNVTFNDTLEYPIFLGGTSFPIFVGGNRITGSADGSVYLREDQSPLEIDISLLETPGIEAQRVANEKAATMSTITRLPAFQPADGLTVESTLTPAIGLGGDFNNIGTLYQADDVTYAITGNFPLIIYIGGHPNPVDPNLRIGRTNPEGSSVTMLPNTVVKLGSGLAIIVLGKLDVQGTQEHPVIFTSIKDDTVGGDTNRDGGANPPNKGDWYTLALESSYTNLTNIVLRYSSSGLYIYFNGQANQNIDPTVSGSVFTENNAGMTLWTPGAGDILSEIHHNLFLDNDIDILGHLNVDENGGPSSGRLLVNIHDNDLLGITSYGVNNLSTNWTILAENNYWGDASGPQHPTNPGGTGVPVSDRVDFTPWLAEPSFTLTYSVQGRVVTNDDIPIGIEGVTINLNNGMTTETNIGGYFIINNVSPGNYVVSASLAGYTFTPSSYPVLVPPDANVPWFVGEVSIQPTYTISGRVRELQNLPVAGVTITLDTGISVVTDIYGMYYISDLVAGTYTVTPTFESYTFTPTSRTVIVGPDRPNQNFTLNGMVGNPDKVYIPIVFK